MLSVSALLRFSQARYCIAPHQPSILFCLPTGRRQDAHRESPWNRISQGLSRVDQAWRSRPCPNGFLSTHTADGNAILYPVEFASNTLETAFRLPESWKMSEGRQSSKTGGVGEGRVEFVQPRAARAASVRQRDGVITLSRQVH